MTIQFSSFPTFFAGHQYSAAAITGALINAIGTDAVSFTIGTEYPNLPPRNFTSLKAAVDEVGASRIFGGLHFRKSIDIGNQLGYNVATAVIQNWSKATFGLPQPPAPAPAATKAPAPAPAVTKAPAPASKGRRLSKL